MHPRSPRGFTASLFFAAAWLCGAAAMAADGLATATFAGGCFWCMEPAFDKLDGVRSVVSGYTGGTVGKPRYEQVSAGSTGHAEAVEITYDPAKITYERLLDVFWHNIDPVTANQQFCDHGTQYRSAIFYRDDRQRELAEASKTALEAEKRFAQPIVTQIVPASIFYPAEEYHQHYYAKNPLRYKYYRYDWRSRSAAARIMGTADPRRHALNGTPAKASRGPSTSLRMTRVFRWHPSSDSISPHPERSRKTARQHHPFAATGLK